MIWLDHRHWFSNPPYWLFAPSSPKFCISCCFQILMEICSRPRNNGLCKIWWAHRVYYRAFENRELSLLLFLWSLFCRSILARNWSTSTARVPQTSQRKIKKYGKTVFFYLKRSFDWDVLLWCCWCTFRYSVRAAGNRLTFYYLLILLIYFFGQQEMKALLREGIPRPCRREVWKRWWSGKGKKLK